MRVMCINAGLLEGHANLKLHLLKEGEIYNVINIHPKTGGYNLGFGTWRGKTIYWGSERFIDCQDVPDEEDKKDSLRIIETKNQTNGNKRSNSEEDQESNSGKPL